jgi:hypothetical protein
MTRANFTELIQLLGESAQSRRSCESCLIAPTYIYPVEFNAVYCAADDDDRVIALALELLFVDVSRVQK